MDTGTADAVEDAIGLALALPCAADETVVAPGERAQPAAPPTTASSNMEMLARASRFAVNALVL